MPEPSFVPLPGSERAPLPEAEVIGPLDPSERIDVTLVTRRRAELPPDLVTGRTALSRDQLASRHGTDPADIELIRTVLARHGIEVTEADPGARRVMATGTAEALAETFGASLSRVRSPHLVVGHGDVEHRYREGGLHVPGELAGIVLAVLGLDDRPQASPQVRQGPLAAARDAAAAPPVSYTPVQVADLYTFPPGTDGTGQIIAIIELGGGFGASDLDAYFSGLGIPAPSVAAAGVDGGVNQPGQDPSGADLEVLLDIEVAGAAAPAAHQIVYFAPNSDRGFVDAVTTAVHATPTPTVVSISWGQSEDSWTGQARTALDQAIADAAALNVTVCAAAGDNGSADGGAGATGGGVSDAFGLPAWQSPAGVPVRTSGGTGRGLPDVAGNADPATGYQVLVDGKRSVLGGTSAVAPLWAALICRLAQATGTSFGMMQTLLYAGVTAGEAVAGMRDITSGSNGAYAAGPGWDACTGLGSPDGTALLARLKA